MLCPHCSSARHILCAEGFRVNVNFSTFGSTDDALTSIKAIAASCGQTHLLGPEPDSKRAPVVIEASMAKVKRDESVLLVLPSFQDTGLGVYGRDVLGALSPANLSEEVAGVVKPRFGDQIFDGEFASTQVLNLAPLDGQRLSVLVIGLGKRDDCTKKGLCGLIGTAVDSAVSGLYSHLVVAISDFTGAPIYGQQLGAVSRCRLSIAVVEDAADLVLSEMTLVVNVDQVAGLCQGIDIAGPLCSHCNHPRAGTIKLARPEPHNQGYN